MPPSSGGNIRPARDEAPAVPPGWTAGEAGGGAALSGAPLRARPARGIASPATGAGPPIGAREPPPADPAPGSRPSGRCPPPPAATGPTGATGPIDGTPGRATAPGSPSDPAGPMGDVTAGSP